MKYKCYLSFIGIDKTFYFLNKILLEYVTILGNFVDFLEVENG